MGIASTEQDILDELKKLSAEPEREEESPEELLQEIDDESEEESEEVEEETEQEIDEQEEDKEEEEELRPAQKRHALKELKAEKEAKAMLEKELNELKLAYARQQGREEAQPKPEVIAEEVPDKDYEPERYAIYKAEQLEKKFQELEAREARSTAEKQWETLQAKRVKSNPDFMDAKAFLLEGEAKRVKAQYPMATPEQIEAHLLQQEYQTVANAARAGLDPLAQIEFLAWQAGFRGKDKEEVEKPKRGANIETIKRNVKKSASLIGGSSGGKVGDSRTAEQLLAMSIADVNKFGKDKYADAIRKLESRA